MTAARTFLTALLVVWASASAADERSVAVVFSQDEIRIIQTYYREAPVAQPRGRAGRLPRGIAKNLARGKPLPPGIAKQYLPADLSRRLPPPPEGHERIVVAGKVLLIEAATQVVRDVLTGVLFR